MQARWLALLALTACLACSRGSATPTPTPTPTPRPTATSTATATPTSTPIPIPTPTSTEAAPAGEAKRSTVPALDRDPLLRLHLATLRDHFRADGGADRGPFLVQRVERAGGGEALLVSRADASDPVVLAVDRDQLVFRKDRPVAGIAPPAEHLAIAPGPERGVALFAYVASLHMVAARMWADDANPFAEIVVMKADACDDLAAGWAPRLGWIVACSSSSGTRAQRLREDLTTAWGDAGLILGAVARVGRPTLAFPSPGAWTLSERVKAVGGDRALTYRYDADAQELQ